MPKWLSILRAWLWINPLIVISTAIHGSLNLLAALCGYDAAAQLRIARAWARSLLRIAGAKVTVEGLENIDPARSYVFAVNHVSYMDTPVMLAHIPANFRFMAKEMLFDVPFLGWHLTKAGHISVPLDDPRAALRVMSEAGRAMVERRVSLLVFPEGGRSLSGKLQEFKDGAAYLALKGGVPVVPCAIIGIHEVLPMHSAHVRPGKVTLRVGAPIETAGLHVRERNELTLRIRAGILALGGGRIEEESNAVEAAQNVAG